MSITGNDGHGSNGKPASSRRKSGVVLPSSSRSSRPVSPLRMRALHDGLILPGETPLRSRERIASLAGLSFAGKRDLYKELGYDRELTIQKYRDRYRRGGVARTIVRFFPQRTWSGGVDIVEDIDPDAVTPFEAAVDSLFSRLSIITRLVRADILASIGRYAVLVIGAEGDPQTELPRMRTTDDVYWLKPLGEDRATIKSFVGDRNQREAANDPRYGEPEFYDVRLSERSNKVYHWSRIIHIAHDTLEDDIYGTPVLEAIWNNLDDLAKVVGGGAEAAWWGMNPGTWFDKDPELEWTDDDEEALEDEIETYYHSGGSRRFGVTTGVTATSLPAKFVTFGPNADAVMDQVAAASLIPKRQLMGSEQGELASSEDTENLNRTIDDRQNSYAEPVIRQLLDRFISYGALPKPSEYVLVWPSEDELTESEKADVVSKYATANAQQVIADGEVIYTASELRDDILGKEPLDFESSEGREGQQSNSDTSVTTTSTTTTARRSAGNHKRCTILAGRVDRLRLAKVRLTNELAKSGIVLRGAKPDTSIAGVTDSLRVVSRGLAFDLTDDPPDDADWKVVHAAGDAHRDSIALSIGSAWRDVAGEYNTKSLLSYLSAGDVKSATNLVNAALDKIDSDLQPEIERRLLDTLIDAGKQGLRKAKKRKSFYASRFLTRDPALAKSNFKGTFSSSNERAVDWASKRSAKLITEIGRDTRSAVRELISSSIENGIAPNRTAALLRQYVGLRSDQMDALFALRHKLTNAEGGYVTAGIVDGETFKIRIPKSGLSGDAINRHVDRYAARQLAYRSNTIARTESIRAANYGQKELWLQAQEDGLLPTNLLREWIDTDDGRTRETHVEQGGQVVQIDQPFSPIAEPGEEVNCRCTHGLYLP